MAVKSTGALSFATDIVGEFADSAPHSMSEFYGGGDKVPAGANPGVATSGTINFNSFYDCVAATVLTISSNTNNYNIASAVSSAGGDLNTPVILTINSGVTVGSTSSGTAAMYTSTGWGSGTTINITNNGSIIGSNGSNTSSQAGGGNGGNGAGGAASAGSAGSGSADSANNGGDAFEHSQTADNNLSVTFATAGTRTGGSAGTKTLNGGGGGGGGGGSADWWYGGGCCYGVAGGGGGGHGTGGGTVGTGGTGSYTNTYGANGSGTNGGAGGCSGSNCGGNGGNGGAISTSGQTGATSSDGHTGGSGGGGGSSSSTSGSAGSALSGNTGQIS